MTIYKRHCNTCGKYYEGQGKKCCSHKCKGIFLKGIKHPPRSKISIENISKAQKLRWSNKDERIKQSENRKGKYCGEFHPNWRGGTSFGKYCPKFNRRKREEIRELYDRKCILCNKPESENLTKTGKQVKLSVHHIDYNKLQGCKDHEWRLVPLCISCHVKSGFNREYWQLKIKDMLKLLDEQVSK